MRLKLQTSGYGMFPGNFTGRFAPITVFESDNGTGSSSGGTATSGDAGSSSDSGSTATSGDAGSGSDSGGDEDVTGLKNALSSERKLKADLERQLKQIQAAYGEISPDAARQAQQRLAQLNAQQEEWNQKETQLTNRLNDEWNRKLQTETQKGKEWQGKYQELKKLILAEAAYQSAGGRAGGSESDGMTFFQAFYNNVGVHLRLNEKEELEVVDATGARLYSKKKDSELMSPAEFFAGYATHPVFSTLFAAQNNSRGSGMNPGAGNRAFSGQVRVIDRNDIQALSEPGVIEALAKGDGSVIIR